MKVDDFSGGLNLKTAPSKLQTREAVELVNADISSKELRSAEAVSTQNYGGVSKYFHQFSGDGLIRSLATKTKFVEYVKELYYIAAGKLTSWDGVAEIAVGVAPPSSAPSYSYVDNYTLPPGQLPVAPSSLNMRALPYYTTPASWVVGGDLPLTTVQNYRVVFYDSLGNNPFHVLSFTGVTLGTDRAIQVSIGLARYTTAVLYRLYLGTYYEVGDFILTTSSFALGNKTVGTIIDSVENIVGASSSYVDDSKVPTEVISFDWRAHVQLQRGIEDFPIYSNAIPVTLYEPALSSDGLSQGTLAVSGYFMEVINTASLPSVGTVTVDILVRRYAEADGVAIDRMASFQGLLRTPIAPTFSYLRQYSNDLILDISGEPEVDSLSSMSGVYQYVYTVYNPSTGIESAPSPIGAELNLDKGKVVLSLTSVAGMSFRVYRVGGNLLQFTLVGEVVSGLIIPGTTEFIDSYGDDRVAGGALTSETYNIAPNNLTLLTEVDGVMLGAIDERLHYSIQGLVFAWPVPSFIDFNRDITLIEECVNGIIVCTTEQTFIITGTSPANYSRSLVSGEHGCISDESYQRLGNGVVFQSRTHLCFTTGGSVQLLTKDKFNPLAISVLASVVHNNTYYAASATDIFILNLTDGSFSTTEIAVNSMGVVDGVVQVTVGTSLVELFGDPVGLLPLTYLSPVFSEGAHSNRKIYKNFYIAANGDFVVELFLNGVSVITKTISGRDTFDVAVPQISQRAIDSQVKITGTGVVYEIEWMTMGRQNGR